MTPDLRYEGVVSLRPVGFVFLLFGAYWGGWAVAAVDVEHALGLSNAGFGLLLSAALVGGAVSNAIGGALCERFGTGRILAFSLTSWAVSLVIGAAMHDALALGLLIVLVVMLAGLVDVTINVAATAALGHQPGRLVAFHARFNGGAAAGAAVMGVMIGVGLTWRWMWVVVAAGALCASAACLRIPLPAGEAGDRVRLVAAWSLLRSEGLLLLAGAFALAAMVEGGVELWGVLFLRTELASGILIGAGGAVLGYTVAALARSILGPRVGRRGPARGVLVGAGSAAIGAAILATAPGAPIAALGLVLATGGISMCWPLLVAQAGAGRKRAGTVVGAVSAVGYLGLIIGPAVVGWVADEVGLRAALGVLAATAAFVALVPTRSKGFAPAPAPAD